MSTRIYTFSGTGNSLWAARELASRLDDDVTLTSVVQAQAAGELRPDAARVGLVCPVYMYRLPHLVVRFLERLEWTGPVFVVVTCGGDVGDLFVHVRRAVQAKGARLTAGLSIRLPSNYIPFGGVPDDSKLAPIHVAARRRVEEVARILNDGAQVVESEHSRSRAWIHPGLLYRLGYRFIPVTDKSYWSTERCNGCGVCVRVCPVGNVELHDGRPRWRQRCEQCMACLQWCPREAVEFKRKSVGQRRYHHPEVRAKDLFLREAD